MNHTIIYRLCIALLFVVSLGSCVQDRKLEDTYQGDLLQFTVSVVDPQSPRAASLRSLRATVTEEGNKYDASLNENKIENMHVFFYEGDHQVEYFSTLNGDITLESPDALTAKVTVKVNRNEATSPLQNKQCDLYVVVNYPNTGESLQGKSLQALKKVVISTQEITDQKTTGANPQPQPRFLMDGHVRTDQMSWSGTKHVHKVPGTVELRRAAAKIRLMIEKIDLGTEHEQLQGVSVALVNGTAQTSLLDGTPAQTLGSTTPPFTRFSTGVRPGDFQPMVKKRYTLRGESSEKEYWVRPIPFYTYENDWSTDGDTRTHLVVKLDIKMLTAGGVTKSFYYSVPVNYLAATSNMTDEQKADLAKVKRNHLYQIVCNITKLGELDPGVPTEMEGAFSVEDWDKDDVIDGNIAKAHYLVVKEKEPEMPNVADRLIEFESDLELDQAELDKFTGEFIGYDYLGEQVLVKGNKNHYHNGVLEHRQYFKDITIEVVKKDGKQYLKVHNPVPNNFVPWKIRFRAQQKLPEYEVTAGAKPLFEDVVVTQYPPIYVTAEKSQGNTLYWYSPFGSWDDGGIDEYGHTKEGHQTNGTLYKVHVLVPEADQIIGDPTGGDPNGKTGRGEELNKLISPEFVIASQWGMTNSGTQQYGSNSHSGGTNSTGWYRGDIGQNTIRNAIHVVDEYWDPRSRQNWRYRDYWDAESRCERYWEDKYGPSKMKNAYYIYIGENSYSTRDYNLPLVTVIGSWRIPSVAELKLIVRIQSDTHSAVKSLLWGQYYWAAKTNTAVWFNNPHVDSWKWGTEFNRPSGDGAPVRAIFDTYNK